MNDETYRRLQCGGCGRYFNVTEPTQQEIEDYLCSTCLHQQIDDVMDPLVESVLRHQATVRRWRNFA